MAQENFLSTITDVLGLSFKQCGVLSNDGYYMISPIINWNYNEIRERCTTKSKLTTTRVKVSYGDQKINCIQSLALWATNLTPRYKQIILSDFDATIMADCIDEAKLDY